MASLAANAPGNPLAVVFAFEQVPLVLAFLMIPGVLVWQPLMWIDSYRHGRMNSAKWALFGALFLVMAFAPYPAKLIAHPFKISSGAMEPTLLGPRDHPEADQVMVNRLAYVRNNPSRFDIVAFKCLGIYHNAYFVVGDHPLISFDSRSFGALPRSAIYGKITAIYCPFSRVGRPK